MTVALDIGRAFAGDRLRPSVRDLGFAAAYISLAEDKESLGGEAIDARRGPTSLLGLEDGVVERSATGLSPFEDRPVFSPCCL